MPNSSSNATRTPQQHARQTPLVICADDYALSAPTSAAILELARLGRISATSAMVLSPLWPRAAEEARDFAGDIDFGLHLDWTSDFAKASGHGRPLTLLMLMALSHSLQPRTLEAVIQQQLDLFEEHFHGAPAHIDGHQHIHQFPQIRAALLRVLQQRYPQGKKPWLRISSPRHKQAGFKQRIIGWMGAPALQRLSEEAGFGHSRHLSGIYDFTGGEAHYAQLLSRWLQQAGAGDVLMCHPGHHDDAGTELAAARDWEFRVLRSDHFTELLTQAGIALQRGSRLFA